MFQTGIAGVERNVVELVDQGTRKRTGQEERG